MFYSQVCTEEEIHSMDKISVIMPAYNVKRTIDKSIQSVFKQTYQNWELIIVDDGSTDHTKEKVFSWMNKEPRIIYLYQTNRGVSEARNTGLDRANGEYISFLDADDLWLPETLQILYGHMKKLPNAKFVYGKTKELFLDGHNDLVGPTAHDGYLEEFIHTNNELRLAYHISGVLINLNLLRQYNIYFESGIRVSEDTGFFIEVMCVTKAYGINKIVSQYVRRNGSATGMQKWKPKDWEGQVVIYFRIERFVQNHRPEAISSFKAMRNYVIYRYVLNCIRNGHLSEGKLYIHKWKMYLQEFSIGTGRLNDKLKCRLMMLFSDYPLLLRYLGRL